MDSIIQMLESISNISSTISSVTSNESEAELAWEVHLGIQEVLKIVADFRENEILAYEASLS